MNNFQITRDGENVRVSLGARLTASLVPELQAALKAEIADGGRLVAFDMAVVDSLDSTGIGLLIAANNSLVPLGGKTRLVNVPPDILKLLQSMRLAERLNATADEGKAADGR